MSPMDIALQKMVDDSPANFPRFESAIARNSDAVLLGVNSLARRGGRINHDS
jgi:hypothetical protein